MTGPLAGIRVIELAAIGPAPFAGMLLADLGADVVRVDRPERLGLLRPDGDSHLVLDRGRRSLSVDLKHRRGPAVVCKLAEQSDVLIEGMRPGVVERLGLGPDVLLARNPRLVYGRMTGWGQDGPDAHKAGHDINYVAVSGALEPIAAPDGGPPVAPLNMLGDFGGGGMLLAVGVVSALVHAQRTGEGQVVDASILDGAALLTAMHRSLSHIGRWDAPRGENLFDGGAPFYAVYRCADDRWLSVGAIEPKFYADLADGLGLSDRLPAEQQYATSEWPRQRRLIADTVASRTRDEWVSVFADLDACVAAVLAPHEAPDAPQPAARGVYARVDGLIHPQPAPRFTATPTRLRPGRASVGEHTAEVLAAFGCTADEIADLLDDGTVYQA
ncbi:CaiB/BaiF CoA transferase family protein [uncultured Jatrophihabitans sp.]|uniref:CaiB/BaiF CoA transferase family protein n=1 Tax=uncultured Jatrophihabitans sp. TaxID=1610747 RepID=UPI0035CB5CFC